MKTTRRGFIQQSSAMVAATSAPWLANLAAISNASAAEATDYKALVCVFLFGGNDYANTVVPYDEPSYQAYVGQRKSLYHRKDSLLMGDQMDVMPNTYRPPNAAAIRNLNGLVLNAPNLGNKQLAIAPPLTEMHDLYQAGKMTVLLNVGTLSEPTVGIQLPSGQLELRKAANMALKADVPVRRFSHNDQILTWQSSNPEGATQGWGGRIGDETGADNAISTFTAISVQGNTVLLTGDSTIPYQVTTQPGLSVSLRALRSPLYGSAAVSNAVGQIMTGTGTVNAASHIFEQDLTTVVKRSIAADDVLRNIKRTEGDAVYAKLTALIEGDAPQNQRNYLAAQLRTVAHMIRNRDTISGTGARRQVFYVGIGGFDTHSEQNRNHPPLLQQVSQAIAAFQATLEDAAIGAGDKVTTFTASDFGRTLNSNNDGTDHGWGSHHFVVGGAVDGGRVIGRAPVPGAMATTTDRVPGTTTFEDVGRGALIPEISVDQYAATLAKWMGVPDEQLPLVLPNITKYGISGWPVDLGFMKSA